MIESQHKEQIAVPRHGSKKNTAFFLPAPPARRFSRSEETEKTGGGEEERENPVAAHTHL